jgi:hypothetical protein
MNSEFNNEENESLMFKFLQMNGTSRELRFWPWLPQFQLGVEFCNGSLPSGTL